MDITITDMWHAICQSLGVGSGVVFVSTILGIVAFWVCAAKFEKQLQAVKNKCIQLLPSYPRMEKLYYRIKPYFLKVGSIFVVGLIILLWNITEYAADLQIKMEPKLVFDMHSVMPQTAILRYDDPMYIGVYNKSSVTVEKVKVKITAWDYRNGRSPEPRNFELTPFDITKNEDKNIDSENISIRPNDTEYFRLCDKELTDDKKLNLWCSGMVFPVSSENDKLDIMTLKIVADGMGTAVEGDFYIGYTTGNIKEWPDADERKKPDVFFKPVDGQEDFMRY